MFVTCLNSMIQQSWTRTTTVLHCLPSPLFINITIINRSNMLYAGAQCLSLASTPWSNKVEHEPPPSSTVCALHYLSTLPSLHSMAIVICQWLRQPTSQLPSIACIQRRCCHLMLLPTLCPCCHRCQQGSVPLRENLRGEHGTVLRSRDLSWRNR